MPSLLDRAHALHTTLIRDVLTLVSCESPSNDRSALANSAAAVADLGTRILHQTPEVIEIDGVKHLRWRLGTGGRRVMLLGHHDTVWPLGTLDRLLPSVADGVMRGPGCLDMKAGLVIAMHACSLARAGSPVTLLVTGDEEVGSPTSRALIEESAVECAGVLVLEAAADDGSLKTARKGVSRYEVTITGRAAHAGLEPEKGRNTTVEAARLVQQIASLANDALGTTVTPSVLRSGTTANTVPDRAMLQVDVRAWTVEEQSRIERAMHALEPSTDGFGVATATLTTTPPLEPQMSENLFAQAQQVARELGLPELRSAAVGGGSDGNLTAGLGIPTLDGLGAIGMGAHAEHEQVDVRSLVQRSALIAGLIERLTNP